MRRALYRKHQYRRFDFRAHLRNSFEYHDDLLGCLLSVTSDFSCMGICISS